MLNANSTSRVLNAFFYCARSAAEPERTKPSEIMGALLQQLASSMSELSIKESMIKEYETRRRKAEEDGCPFQRLRVKDCTRLILELTKVNPATIIIDALDESENTRHELLEALNNIINKSANVVKILITSRDTNDIVSPIR